MPDRCDPETNDELEPDVEFDVEHTMTETPQRCLRCESGQTCPEHFWDTAPVPAPEPSHECMGVSNEIHFCVQHNSSLRHMEDGSNWKPAAAPTGTGEGSAPLTPTEELLLESVLAENASLRSQLEEASIPEGKIDAVFVGPIVRKIYGDSAELGHYKLAIEAFKQGREGTLVVLGQLGMAKLRAEEAQRENEEVRLGIGTLQRLKGQAERDFATAQARIARYEADLKIIANCSTRPRCKACSDRAAEALAEPQSGEK